jgi:uncharacterized membrane protein
MTESGRKEDLVQDTLSEAWNLFTSDFVLWIIAGLIMLVVTVVSFGILLGPMTVGFIQLVERRLRDEAVSAADIFDGFAHFGASLIAFILICIGVAIGSLLLILPGLLFGLAMSFAFHAIAIDDEDAMGAMEKSFNLIKKDLTLSAVFLVIVLVLSGIGGAVGFGILLTMPFTLILWTLAYHRLSALSGGRPSGDVQ